MHFIPHYPYLGCWWPCLEMNQGISKYNIKLFLQECFDLIRQEISVPLYINPVIILSLLLLEGCDMPDLAFPIYVGVKFFVYGGITSNLLIFARYSRVRTAHLLITTHTLNSEYMKEHKMLYAYWIPAHYSLAPCACCVPQIKTQFLEAFCNESSLSVNIITGEQLLDIPYIYPLPAMVFSHPYTPNVASIQMY